MPTYTVDVRYTVSGWMQIEAKDLPSAIKKASELNDAGISLDVIQDREDSSEVLTQTLSLRYEEDATKECHVCEHPFDIDEHGIAHHRTQDGEVDYDQDGHHVPYALEDDL
jgi:hypothetical protein